MDNSSSSSLGDNATMADATCYDVFLSFRGEDTRDSFTDHLYEALGRAGLLTFRDNDGIDRGRELKPEIERAIKASKASIVVLSRHYATSTWCLEELWLILEQRRQFNHFVLPVFYHVDPSDVRKQEKTFKIQVKTSSKWTDDNVKRWREALTKVGHLTGEVLSGPETKFLKEIVDTVYNELDCKKVYLPPDLIGMDTRYEEITSWLHQPNLEFLAICGMGGSGKTTLAKYIYNLNWKRFENMSFLEDIGSRCKGAHGFLELQEQLLKDISGGRKRKIPSVSHGTCKIEEALQTKRALIVLDDIVEYSELVALLGTGKINAQSKIIITTENTDNWFKFSSHKCEQYKMRLLNDDESLELLSRHAFGSKFPAEGIKELAAQAVRYCDGNPLGLGVLGSSLSNSNTILQWRSQLNLLEKDIHSLIQSVLMRSYMSLPFDFERELFLHIACFFIGKDMDYVVKILEPDYSAVSGIKTLINRCLLEVSPSNKLVMHRLLQETGRNIVCKESFKFPEKRSRVWLSADSYKILRKGKGSKTIEGLTLDMKKLKEEGAASKSSDLKTDALEKMEKLKLLQLNFAELTGSHENFSEDLRWLCWFGFHLRTIPSGLFMGNLVALDMSYSNLEVFEPPMVLESLQILNLKDSHNLYEIRNISMIPHLETLVLWNCHSLVRVCETIGELTGLALLNMTGCKHLCTREQIDQLEEIKASTSGGQVTKQPPFSFPHSLQRLFLKDCNLGCTDSFPLSFSVQPFLQYLNLCNSLFEFLPCYDHLKSLRILDLSFCSRLKWLLRLPSTLAELYVYYCESLEKITFQSSKFTLQEFGYEGCINLCEIEDFLKLVPLAKLDETDLGHLKWLKKYQSHEVLLVGDYELIKGRSSNVQMLYEFDIMSTSLPNIKDSKTIPEYISESSSLSFDVPLCPKNWRLKGLNVTFKYTLSGDVWAWFAKISTTNGVDLMYNPKVFGKPGFGEVGIWLGYWPIGSTLNVGDKVNVSIDVMSGVEVHECGASLVYTDDEIAEETVENNMGLVEILGGDLSRFQLSTGAYYLCRRDFFELMEVGRLTPSWFRVLVGDTMDYAEVRGWRKAGRPKQSNPSYTELKTVKCIISGPELEEIYKIAEMSKSSFVDKTVEITSNILGETTKSRTMPEISDAARKDKSDGDNLESVFDQCTTKNSQDIIRILEKIVDMESICEDAVVANEKPSNFTPMLRSGEWSDIGHRPHMEDTHICILDLAKNFSNKLLGEEAVSFYGVFDGHGGIGASHFVRDNLPRIIVDDANFPLELEKVVTRAFMETDAAFARSCALEPTLSSGTTALTAMIFGRSLLVANAGDSRAILSRHGLAFEMSKDHWPSNDKERIRIESLGGFVEDGYLNGQLAVTRAIGNWHIKGLKEMDEHVGPLSAEPELKLITLTKEDEFLIIASDGIWDVFSNKNAVDFVRRRLQEHNDVKQCCKEMVEEAMKRGAFDNLTVVIVCFQAEAPSHVVVQRGRVSKNVSREGLLNLTGRLLNAYRSKRLSMIFTLLIEYGENRNAYPGKR